MSRVIALALCCLAAALPQDELARRIEEILPRLREDSLETRDAAVRALGDLGPAALGLLRKRAESLDGEPRERVLEAVKLIESKDTLLKHLPRLQQVTLDLKNRSAREGFEELSRQIQIPVDLPEGQIFPSVTVFLKDALPLEALDTLARAAGASWRAEERESYGFRRRRAAPPAQGPRLLVYVQKQPAYPAAWVRHYRIQVQQVLLTRIQNFQANASNAHLTLGLAWLPDVRPDSVLEMRVSELRDDQGRSLLPEPNAQPRMSRYRQRSHLAFTHNETVPFKFPENDARSLALLRGSALLAFPKETSTLVFAKPGGPAETLRELGGLKITLRDFKTTEKQVTFTIETGGRFEDGPQEGSFDERLPFSYEDIEVLTEGGERLQSQGMSGSGGNDGYTWELRYGAENAGPVKEIRIPCILKRHTDEVVFEIKDIPLPR